MLFTRKKFMFSDFTWQKIFATRFFALPEKDRRNLFYGGDVCFKEVVGFYLVGWRGGGG